MVEQASLESKFGEQECSNNEKFVMAEPLKRCRKCREWKTLDQFRLRTKGKYIRRICNESELERQRYRRESGLSYTREEERENNFLTKKRGRGFLLGTGMCMICGEINHRFLENHHTFPEEYIIMSLCSNHHRCYQSSNRDKHMIAVLNAIESSKFLWDSDGQPKGLKPIPMWTVDLPLKEAIQILKSYDLPGYEPIGI